MRLIDADALINELIECKQGYIGTHNDVVLHDLMCDNAIAWADGAETIEAVPVVYGNFMFDLYGEFAQCNRCFEEFEAEYANTYKFCPNCGAKMDGD